MGPHEFVTLIKILILLLLIAIVSDLKDIYVDEPGSYCNYWISNVKKYVTRIAKN